MSDGIVSLELFCSGVDIPKVPRLDVICYDKWVLSKVYKNDFKNKRLIHSQPTFLILPQFLIQYSGNINTNM